MRFGCVILFCAAVTVAGTSVLEEWREFKSGNQKTYKSDEEDQSRMKIFAENKKRVSEHNQRFKQKLVTYRMRLNPYADLKPDEYTRTMFGYDNSLKHNKLQGRTRIKRASKLNLPKQEKYPAQMDWRKKGAVTPIKSQGSCGSCWSFSSTGALEGQLFRKTGQLVPLSEQNLMDCTWMYGNRGCNGGRMEYAFDYVMNNTGIATELSYPYENDMNDCRYRPVMTSMRYVKLVGYEAIPSGNEKKLMQAVATVGPVAVAVDASKPGFEFYYDGVYYDPTCSSTNLNHAMLVVGYGTDELGGDYWLVKNSYGLHWGDKGYIKMARNRNNHCGIASTALYPVVK